MRGSLVFRVVIPLTEPHAEAFGLAGTAISEAGEVERSSGRAEILCKSYYKICREPGVDRRVSYEVLIERVSQGPWQEFDNGSH